MHMPGMSPAIGSWCWEVDHDRCFADAFTCRLFGVDPGDGRQGVKSKRFLDAICATDRPRVQRLLHAMAASGEAFEEDYHVVDTNGRRRRVLASGQCFRARDMPGIFAGHVVEVRPIDFPAQELIGAAIAKARSRKNEAVAYILEIALSEARKSALDSTPIDINQGGGPSTTNVN